MSHHLVRNRDRATWKSVGRSLLIGLAILLPASWCHAAIHFNEISRFDLSATSAGPSYIGGFPFTVAWNGNKLFVGGLRTTGANPASIIEILNATTTGVVSSPSFGAPFGGVDTTSNHFGYTAIELKGNLLAAANDPGNLTPGVNEFTGIQLFDTSNNNLVLWDYSDTGQAGIRGIGGVAFDPGHNANPAAGGGVAHTQLNSGRRLLLNETTGALIYGTTVAHQGAGIPSGFPFLPTGHGGSNNPRDLTFDPATGDLYVIRNGQVLKAARTGTNTSTSPLMIADVPAGHPLATSLNGQHIAFMDTTVGGNLVIYNDLSTPPGGSNADTLFSDRVKVIDTVGASQAVSFNLIGGGSVPNSDSRYDFAFDSASQTLAILDVRNRSVSIFAVVPEPTTATLLIVAAGLTSCIVRRRVTMRIVNEGGER